MIQTSRTAVAPGIDAVRAGLERVLGTAFADTWDALCQRSGIDPAAHTVDEAHLEALLGAMARDSAACHLQALSWRVRRAAIRELVAAGR